MDRQKRRLMRLSIPALFLSLGPVLSILAAKELSAMSAIQDTDPTTLTWASAQERLGPPETTEVFPLAPELPEFRTNVPEAAGPEAVAARAPVREATWPLNDTHNRTIWFIERDDAWRYLLHFDWEKGLEF
jgi:hypothetical protein